MDSNEAKEKGFILCPTCLGYGEVDEPFDLDLGGNINFYAADCPTCKGEKYIHADITHEVKNGA